jgi:glycosyltransferase involved in cell wall biosynthesis
MAPVIVLRPGRRHFGIQSLADQLLRAFPGLVEAFDPYERTPEELADLAADRTMVSPMLDGTLPDFTDHARAAQRARRSVWIPMSEYLAAECKPEYRSWDVIASPTREAAAKLQSWGVDAWLVRWQVEPSETRPTDDSSLRLLHFSYGRHGRAKSGTDLVLDAWPQLRKLGCTLTVKSRTHLPAPDDVRVISDDWPDLEGLWRDHAILLQPYRRCGIGLPPLEAMARGVVPLVTGGTAVAEWAPASLRLPSAESGVFLGGKEFAAISAAFPEYVERAARLSGWTQDYADRQEERYQQWRAEWERILWG